MGVSGFRGLFRVLSSIASWHQLAPKAKTAIQGAIAKETEALARNLDMSGLRRPEAIEWPGPD